MPLFPLHRMGLFQTKLLFNSQNSKPFGRFNSTKTFHDSELAKQFQQALVESDQEKILEQTKSLTSLILNDSQFSFVKLIMPVVNNPLPARKLYNAINNLQRISDYFEERTDLLPLWKQPQAIKEICCKAEGASAIKWKLFQNPKNYFNLIKFARRAYKISYKKNSLEDLSQHACYLQRRILSTQDVFQREIMDAYRMAAIMASNPNGMHAIAILDRGVTGIEAFEELKDKPKKLILFYEEVDENTLLVQKARAVNAILIKVDSLFDENDCMQKLRDLKLPPGFNIGVYVGVGPHSENKELARKLKEERHIHFMGPTADAMHALGDKWELAKLAKKLGIPTIPSISSEEDDKSILDVAEKMYPVLVKRTVSGGGIGIWEEKNRKGLSDRIARCRLEGWPFIVSQFLEPVLHVEIQVLAGEGEDIVATETDQAPEPVIVVADPVRFCGIQRAKREKLGHECTNDEIAKEILPELDKMKQDAYKLAKAVGLKKSLITVEFLVVMENGKPKEYKVLEVNARRQLELFIASFINNVDLLSVFFDLWDGKKLEDILRSLLPEDAQKKALNAQEMINKIARNSPRKAGSELRIYSRKPINDCDELSYAPVSQTYSVNMDSFTNEDSYFTSSIKHEYINTKRPTAYPFIGIVCGFGDDLNKARTKLLEVSAQLKYSGDTDLHYGRALIAHLLEKKLIPTTTYVPNVFNPLYLKEHLKEEVNEATAPSCRM